MRGDLRSEAGRVFAENERVWPVIKCREIWEVERKRVWGDLRSQIVIFDKNMTFFLVDFLIEIRYNIVLWMIRRKGFLKV